MTRVQFTFGKDGRLGDEHFRVVLFNELSKRVGAVANVW